MYVKPTNTGPLLHYQSHADAKYKHSLLSTMLDRVFKLSSNCQFFHQECERLKRAFTCLIILKSSYITTPEILLKRIVTENACSKHRVSDEQDAPIRIVLPLED